MNKRDRKIEAGTILSLTLLAVAAWGVSEQTQGPLQNLALGIMYWLSAVITIALFNLLWSYHNDGGGC